VAGVVLDPLAETQLFEHLQVEAGALLDPLGLDQFLLVLEKLDSLAQFRLDRLDRLDHRGPRCHIMTRREYGETPQPLPRMSGQRVEQGQRLNVFVEQGDAQCVFGVFGREDINDVAANPVGASMKVGFIPFVLHFPQTADDVALPEFFSLAQVEDHAVVIDRVADAVDRGHGAHDHYVAPLQQALGGRKPHLFDVFVDRRILLDEQIARRNVGFRLVVVVIGNEILHGIVREELPKFRIELRRQCLVRRQDQRRPPQPGDDVGHRVGLARAGDAQQGLEGKSILDAIDEQPDRLGLIPGRRERLVQAIGAEGEWDDGLLGHQKFRSNSVPGRVRRIGYYCALPGFFRTQEQK